MRAFHVTLLGLCLLPDGTSFRERPDIFLAVSQFREEWLDDFRPDPPVLAGWIRESGFAACGWQRRAGGIVAIHTAIKG